jgi:SET domain-containing protein
MTMQLSWLTKKAKKMKVSHGFGIFATKNIKKDERVIVFGGYVMTTKQFDSLPERMQDFPFQIDDDLYFGLSKPNEIEEADFLNHSCNPTCGFRGDITIVAMRDIKKGEEITMDYAICSNNKRSIGIEECLCGSEICRKTISSTDWKNKDIQKRYKGYFAPFLQRKIV